MRAATSAEEEILASLDMARLPGHIAIIMDGNGCRARERSLPRLVGHRAGSESVRAAIETCGELGIGALTLYTFSAENWRRPSDEVQALMALIQENLSRELEELHQKGVRISAIGRLAELPTSVQQEIARATHLTRGNQGLRLNLAINYGGRAEIVDAAIRLVERAGRGEIQPSQIDEALFASQLYDPSFPDPDLLIRTGGELRVSNYLLWQIAYTEIWVSPVLWPDFRRVHLLQAISDYQRRQRRFGATRPPGA